MPAKVSSDSASWASVVQRFCRVEPHDYSIALRQSHPTDLHPTLRRRLGPLAMRGENQGLMSNRLPQL